MSAVLLTRDEWEQMLRLGSVPSGQVPALGTIVELLEMAELARKEKGTMSLGEFRRGFESIRAPRGSLAEGRVVIASLDQACLVDSLFDEQRGQAGVSLWSDVVGTEITPAKCVRRLILRPSNSHWWPDEAYKEMEGREEISRDG